MSQLVKSRLEKTPQACREYILFTIHDMAKQMTCPYAYISVLDCTLSR